MRVKIGALTDNPGVLREMSDAGQRRPASVSRIVATLLVYGIVAIPLGGYTWEVVSELIAGHVEARQVLIGVPVFLALLIVLRLAARAFLKLDARHTSDEA